MQKFSRNNRIAAITKILLENPNKIIGLNNFTEMFNTAKSTVSEDIVVIRDTLSRLHMGRIDTISGAAGGIKYIGGISPEKTKKFAEKLCIILKNRERIIPGNFLYMTDVMFNPNIIHMAGMILASIFIEKNIDCVVTVETKGIPLAYEVAKMMGVQLVVARRETKFTEGSTITINYVSGSTGKIQNMSLSKKALKNGSKCIFIDDFMKAGGTAMGIIDLLKEFESELLGIGFLIDNVGIPKKLVQNYVSIVDFEGINENGDALLTPSKMFS
ncbi:MAG TPA: pur operon repressor [Clostridium sp.]|uniref:Pur operon repressor n=1 Tax=Clostridium lapidicellarium TaxID=3240931 RepID=A0ABV4DXS9_9CLOT|nr:pur operon repressor [uncultured Clostridium sp.]NLU07217.1 pur operon repressor [Clostridiales bacterium]HBC95452.1 pur operon repressor [Clostridium sp.]